MNPMEMVNKMADIIANYGEVTEVNMFGKDQVTVRSVDKDGNEYILKFYVMEAVK